MHPSRYALCLALACTAAFAEPPPGHPSPAETSQMLGIQPGAEEQSTHQATVLHTFDTATYTYLEVRQADGATAWLAGPRTEVRQGQQVRYGEGAVMRNFYSKSLQRTFDEIRFVDRVVVLAEGT
jgi:hypothetical protein